MASFFATLALQPWGSPQTFKNHFLGSLWVVWYDFFASFTGYSLTQLYLAYCNFSAHFRSPTTIPAILSCLK